MGRSFLLAVVMVCCASIGPSAAQEGTRCLYFSGTADSIRKPKAIEDSLASLKEAVDKWKTDNGITGPVTQTAQKPEPHPYWRRTISPELFLPPDTVTESTYTLCWKGVVSPVVCTSGAKLCW